LEKGLFSDVNRLDLVPHIDVGALGRSYRKSTRPFTGHSAHFTDKLPGNYINTGLIALALPNAKIVHVTRNPMDSCFAMYKQPFAEAYYFSYNQVELGQYYLAYRRLMDHWQRILPGRLIEVRYEDLVMDTERTVRDLIGALGLPWQGQCLDHTKNQQAAMTASAQQVRQPIYTSSVGKWRGFAQWLAPLREVLEAGDIDLQEGSRE
jgi:hypothetical protein